MNQEMPKVSYLLWYSSKSHKKARFFIGAMKAMVNGHPLLKPAWSYSKDESQIFDELSEVRSAKDFCEKCGYNGLIIEPIDNKPIWTPQELVKVDKPSDPVATPLKAVPMEQA